MPLPSRAPLPLVTSRTEQEAKRLSDLDRHRLSVFIGEMVDVMVAGEQKGYNPELSQFIRKMVKTSSPDKLAGKPEQYWQLSEGIAKLVRAANKLETGNYVGARQDLVKVACAAYTVARDWKP